MKKLRIYWILMLIIMISGCPNDDKPQRKMKFNKKDAALIDNLEFANITLFSEKSAFFHLFDEGNGSLKKEVLKNTDIANNINQLALSVTKLLQMEPEQCSLYVLRAYLSALIVSEESLFYDIQMISKFNPDEWFANLMIAYGYYQQFEDEKALKYLDKAMKLYCKKNKNCTKSKKDTYYHSMLDLKKKIISEKDPDKILRSEIKLADPKECKFIEVFPDRNEKGEEITWSGECKNGWAHGKGVLHYKIGGNKYNMTMNKGRISGPAEYTDDDGFKHKGELKNGIHVGRWKVYNKNNEIINEISGYDKYGRWHGDGVEIFEGKKMKYEGEFRHGRPMRSGRFSCFYKTEKEREVRFKIYRHLHKRFNQFIPLCHIPTNKQTKKKIETSKEMFQKQFKKLNKIASQRDLSKKKCSLKHALDHIKENIADTTTK